MNVRQGFKVTGRIAIMAAAAALLLLIVACDPGVIIRQVGPVSGAVTQNSVILHVKSTHQLIGETWYAPQVTVTNSSHAPITITEVELSTKQKIYSDSSPQPQDLPKTVLPGQTQNVTVLFRLDDDVQKTFRQSAELRVHYRGGNTDDIVRAVIELGPVDDSR